MNKELDKKLVEKYPEIFRDRHADMRQTAMCWGFDCDDGWYTLIDSLCADIITLTKGQETPIASQVKEKYGSLRFYVQRANDTIFDRIAKAEKESETICEICGTKGKLREKHRWLKTLCATHAKERGYTHAHTDTP